MCYREAVGQKRVFLPMSWWDPSDQHLAENSGAPAAVLMQAKRPQTFARQHAPHREDTISSDDTEEAKKSDKRSWWLEAADLIFK